AGLAAVYMTGFGTAASRGFPDMGLLTMTEMVAGVRAIADSTSLPAICDADTGYGNPLNVQRTVREYERAGAAALHLEDQVWPKRCGFFEGKEVIPLEEHVQKIRSACDAREDPDLVVIARSDALQTDGWDAVEERARAYRDAGADLIFVDGLKAEADVDTYCERLRGLPLAYNGVFGVPDDLAARGIQLVLNGAPFAATVGAVSEAMQKLAAGQAASRPEDGKALATLLEGLGVADLFELAGRYK
ncbi:MAG: isocitrate lyase/PEP mutase family protein, partial [Deltaproteobacteria bacterium]|nr:isocitrate lyase/PEP mutase family protein [Deltaproteobacteria bacterium]